MKTSIAELTAQLSAENEKAVILTAEAAKANVRSHNNEMVSLPLPYKAIPEYLSTAKHLPYIIFFTLELIFIKIIVELNELWTY